MTTQQRALLSTYDKTGVVELADGLSALGWELLASAGTARTLAAAGLAVTDVAEYTGSPVMLSHRVVTLHPRIHGGILADRDDPTHRADLEANAIEPIDLVVANLYPFEDSPGIDTIDIGGPAMVRAAAKNHAHVGVVVDPGDYRAVLNELRAHGRLSAQRCLDLARKAFAHTAAYDAAIVSWLNAPTSSGDPLGSLPRRIVLELERAETLRYGENPHQRAARYRRVSPPGASDAHARRGRHADGAAGPLRGAGSLFDNVEHISGSPLSYLNLLDAAAAWNLAHDLGERPAAVIVKHANPCGVAVADELATAYARSFDCDPRSAFGGVVALNQVIDTATAKTMVAAAQADVVIAPGYGEGVIERLAARRASTRLLQAPAAGPGSETPLEIRSVGSSGGDFLVQTPRSLESQPSDWQVVTQRTPRAAVLADAVFAWRVCAHTGSNAVVLARDLTAWGIGAGQQNRIEAGQIAAAKAAGRAAGGACASDAFFPFPDGIHAAADAGVAVVVQPGGSVNDAAVIAAADERGLAMLFTGERQFRH